MIVKKYVISSNPNFLPDYRYIVSAVFDDGSVAERAMFIFRHDAETFCWTKNKELQDNGLPTEAQE